MLAESDPATLGVKGLSAVIYFIKIDSDIGVILRGGDKAEVGATKPADGARIVENVTFDLPKNIGLETIGTLI